MKFKKITKKQFIVDMTASSVIFADNGFTTKVLEDESFENRIIEVCESIDIDSAEQCKCIAHSNSLERILPNGESSWLYLDQKCKRCFYEYGNIRIMNEKYEDSERSMFLIYLCV